MKRYFQVIFLVIVIALSASCKEEKAKQNRIFSIKEMGELATVEYAFTKIISASDEGSWYKFGDRKIIFSVNAYAKAGIDMQAIGKEQIIIDGDNITLNLPAVKIMSLSIPPEEIIQEASISEGFRSEFTNEEKSKLLVQAEKQIKETVKTSGIIKQAESNAKLFLTDYLKQLGFKTVTINFENPKLG